ncbi:unnamed protein product [Blepharisma stoltei]|uniref:Peptidase C19 ubiquitin carboxyl-terminal hydrolase domain-containing protein n=1 Tax=Blepharisma stoltei TaxID=1481888 RepID=A0AAU9IZJ6_9CILI|nr:unnamed protein product [Blepharisma stoltei]
MQFWALASNDRFVNFMKSIGSHSFATVLYGVFNIMREKRGNTEQALRSFKDQANQEFPFLDSLGQQDSKEFLVYLLSKLEELSSVILSNITLIQEFLCMTCRKSYQNQENQSFLWFQIIKQIKSVHLKELKAKVQYFRGDNMLYCQFCDSPRNMSIAIKKVVCSKMLIFYLPANTNFSNTKIEEKLKVEDYEFSLYGVICYYVLEIVSIIHLILKMGTFGNYITTHQ